MGEQLVAVNLFGGQRDPTLDVRINPNGLTMLPEGMVREYMQALQQLDSAEERILNHLRETGQPVPWPFPLSIDFSDEDEDDLQEGVPVFVEVSEAVPSTDEAVVQAVNEVADEQPAEETPAPDARMPASPRKVVRRKLLRPQEGGDAATKKAMKRTKVKS